MSLSLEGIGATLMNENDYTKITRIIPAGPADKAKNLFENDRIYLNKNYRQNDPYFSNILMKTRSRYILLMGQ